MTFIIRNADGSIKTFAERSDDFVLTPGETIESSPLSFARYAQRFTLSSAERSGETIAAHVGDPVITVEVSCPEQLAVDLDINGTIEHLELAQGKASLALSTEIAGAFVIQPADRKLYSAAGNGTLIVEVVE